MSTTVDDRCAVGQALAITALDFVIGWQDVFSRPFGFRPGHLGG
jgi:hypothetical protein